MAKSSKQADRVQTTKARKSEPAPESRIQTDPQAPDEEAPQERSSGIYATVLLIWSIGFVLTILYEIIAMIWRQ